ncbi:L-fuculose phosphate aldolase (modular protein) [Candidatus Filomicrobium marinum]|uniref:L-fuculose phosphate aldolase (Modular protein) n=1 Tax=Candidatus Filomicrobium marinum TaxID=1608628 RepID=A0A0D6JGA0_9HYPH|nr:class II aldolase/adducin family protein [Candidatus Filomicrobium marinum]CFX52469.1 L-fuculose phosphate aldolase (modular protein) [Candidatus Filomicrobium marinum]CPR20022.1 L-fuculose phosphate aldolase (modular protein) [Candidatus Filomicrobium marinum]
MSDRRTRKPRTVRAQTARASAPAAKVAKKPAKKSASQTRSQTARAKRPVVRKAKTSEVAQRRAVIATALDMCRTGLSPGRSGNVSCRWPGGMLITPSGMAYEEIEPADIVFVADDGSVRPKSRKPSSEWQFHLSAYHARPDRHAVIHTHSMHATVLACAHKSIPAFHYMVAIAGGMDIPLVSYATFGTKELADIVAAGLAERDACLMANHGQIAVGTTLGSALELAHEVEFLAEQYFKVLTLGKPKLLSTSEMKVVLERFKGYGQHAQD